MIVTKFIELVFCSSDSKAQTNLHAGSLALSLSPLFISKNSK